MKRSIIFDCDPGQDDAVALLFAMAATQFDILGITVVAGNVPLNLTTMNALKICELAKQPNIPVYAGCPRPILKPLVTATSVHGKTGMDGADIPDPVKRLEQDHAVEFILQTLKESPKNEITLFVTGPMTNIAMAMTMAPEVMARAKEIVFMGGAINGGNITPAAEFNFYVDPHAAKIVLDSGIKLTMLGLDVTHQAMAIPDRIERIKKLGTPVGDNVASILSHFSRFDKKRFDMEGGPIHDACVVGYALAPHLFEGKSCHVDVEVTNPLTEGQSIVDWWGVKKLEPNVFVINKMNVDVFFDVLIEHLGKI